MWKNTRITSRLILLMAILVAAMMGTLGLGLYAMRGLRRDVTEALHAMRVTGEMVDTARSAQVPCTSRACTPSFGSMRGT